MFVYRYRTVCGQNGDIPFIFKNLKLVYAFAVFYCLLQSSNAFFCSAVGQTEELRQIGLQILDRYNWGYNHSAPPFPALSYATEPKNILHHVIYVGSLTVGYTIIIWCQGQIMTFMNKHGKSVHANTRRMHAEVNRALVALAITPSIALIVPVAIMMASLVFQITLGSVSAFVSTCLSIITVANPLTTIYFVRPFRQAVLKFITCGLFGRKSNAISHQPTTTAQRANTSSLGQTQGSGSAAECH
ncbi:serpentine type 7TM GPCR chemoreceptor srd domain-containing protein [Ditylenchus destructor]|uniref:Serpentine type 7TM GPCR chemoreceptor srd domain-containing protein n=1 Tax=Ditylenchus destructor TaxID=166010 RepID=A0AAD4QZX6_9BILA|nr:serpentine type 7TM GPCR chemoreceptor srd domain-containing protein [Ditylenchus destructor]